MMFQSAMSGSLAETVFRSVVSSITVTSTDASLQEGEPVVLDTAGTPVGGAVIRALTVTNIGVNRLVVGAVKGTIPHESVGLVQVYGVGPVRLKEVATVAVGDRLVPDLNTTATALTPFGRGAWISRTLTDTDLNYQSGAAVIAVAPATAVSGTAGVTQGSAFIRAM
jgi:hypothetical protein